MHLVQLYRELGNSQVALEECELALEDKQNRNFYKLWLIKAQLLEELGQIEPARKTYELAIQQDELKTDVKIWLEFVAFEER